MLPALALRLAAIGGIVALTILLERRHGALRQADGAGGTIITIRILVGDAKERLGEVGDAHVVITDPVWPNCPEGIAARLGSPRHGAARSA